MRKDKKKKKISSSAKKGKMGKKRHLPKESKKKISATKKFQRKKEDFICGRCSERNTGNGYTNHCFSCLWSRHVDINPGDRAEVCKGMMEPIDIEIKGGEHIIIHKCEICGFLRKNKVGNNDLFEAVISVSKRAGGIKIG